MSRGGFDFWNPRRRAGLDYLHRPQTERAIRLPTTPAERSHPILNPSEFGALLFLRGR